MVKIWKFITIPFRWFWHLSWKKKSLIIIGLIILLVIIGQLIPKDLTKGYEFTTPEIRDITQVVSESGTIVTASQTPVFSPSTGTVAELYVHNGDLVGLDQPLFKVISTATEDEVAAAVASVSSAKAALNTAEQAKLTYQTQLEQARQTVLSTQSTVDAMNDRLKESQDNPSTGRPYIQLEIDTINSSMTSALYSFKTVEKKFVEADQSICSAGAALHSAQLAYESTQDRVISSSDIGTVSNLSVSQGDSVAAPTAATIVSARPVLNVANFTSNRITVEIRESDIDKIIPGQSVTIEPDSLHDQTYQGIVDRVDDIGTIIAGVTKYYTYINILNPDDQLKSGMTVDVDITTQTAEQVLSLPNAAVKPYQGGRAVRVLDHKGEIEYLPVTIGLKGTQYTQIIDGLTPDTQVIISASNNKVSSPGGGLF